MKKLLLSLTMLIMVCFAMCTLFNYAVVNADDGEEIVEETITIEDVQNQLKDYIDKNVEDNNIKEIIYLVLFGGVGTALIGVYIKYRKYRHNTLEDVVKSLKEVIIDEFKENFKDLSKENLSPLIDIVNKLENSIETMMKVLVLAQDKTAEGRLALINFLGSKTENNAIKESVVEVEKNIEEEKKIEQEVKEKVIGDYKDISVF